MTTPAPKFVRRCPYCRYENNAGARKCENCGKDISKIPPTSPQQANPLAQQLLQFTVRLQVLDVNDPVKVLQEFDVSEGTHTIGRNHDQIVNTFDLGPYCGTLPAAGGMKADVSRRHAILKRSGLVLTLTRTETARPIFFWANGLSDSSEELKEKADHIVPVSETSAPIYGFGKNFNPNDTSRPVGVLIKIVVEQLSSTIP